MISSSSFNNRLNPFCLFRFSVAMASSNRGSHSHYKTLHSHSLMVRKTEFCLQEEHTLQRVEVEPSFKLESSFKLTAVMPDLHVTYSKTKQSSFLVVFPLQLKYKTATACGTDTALSHTYYECDRVTLRTRRVSIIRQLGCDMVSSWWHSQSQWNTSTTS